MSHLSEFQTKAYMLWLKDLKKIDDNSFCFLSFDGLRLEVY